MKILFFRFDKAKRSMANGKDKCFIYMPKAQGRENATSKLGKMERWLAVRSFTGKASQLWSMTGMTSRSWTRLRPQPRPRPQRRPTRTFSMIAFLLQPHINNPRAKQSEFFLVRIWDKEANDGPDLKETQKIFPFSSFSHYITCLLRPGTFPKVLWNATLDT